MEPDEMRAHTAIVGGGIMGLSIAAHLAPRLHALDEPLVLLERRDLGAGSSGRSAAILRQHYADPLFAAMARDSLRVWAGFEAATGYSVGYRRTGVAILARSQAARERLRANVAMLRALGVATELVEGEALRARVPGIACERDTLAAWEPDGGFVDPARALAAFAAVARFRGAVTRTDCAVTGLVVEGGRLTGLSTVDGPLSCESAVLAAGPWTRALLAPHGIDLPLDVAAPRQQMLAMPPTPPGTRLPETAELAPLGAPLSDAALRAVGEEPAQPAAHPVVLDLEHGFAARCEPGQARTRIAALDLASMPRLADPDALDESPDARFAAWARDAAARRLPAYRERADLGQLAGWYTLTPDDRPLIGPVPGIEGLWVVAGFNGHGFKLAPSIGEGVARLLCGEAALLLDAALMSPSRFDKGYAPPHVPSLGL
jgi:glycine/D-amino acid oxidase-like deaminating enzyme